MEDTLKFRIPKEDKDGLLEIAKEERTTAASLVRKLIVDFLRSRKK